MIHSQSDPDRWDALVAGYEAMAHPFTTSFAEAAVAKAGVGPSTRVLDVATGTGAVALAAARAGADVVAIDFSAGMVRRVLSHGLTHVAARQMDGQALDLPDASFDAVISVFGVMLFPDWMAGLREMSRVTAPGGRAAVAVWKDPEGAGPNLLLAQVCDALCPDLVRPRPFPGMTELCDPGRLSAAMVAAGFVDPEVADVTHDFRLRIDALADAETLFDVAPLWRELGAAQRVEALREIRARADRGRVGEALPIASTALLAIARKPS